MATGKLSQGIVDTAADLAALGLDPLQFLRIRDSMERSLIMEIYERMLKRKEILDHNLAVAIATEVSKIFKVK